MENWNKYFLPKVGKRNFTADIIVRRKIMSVLLKSLIAVVQERKLEKSIGDGKEESSNLDMFSLEMFENIAFIMAKHADPSIPDTPEE